LIGVPWTISAAAAISRAPFPVCLPFWPALNFIHIFYSTGHSVTIDYGRYLDVCAGHLSVPAPLSLFCAFRFRRARMRIFAPHRAEQ
jgi:hypothetical protein